MSDTEITRSRLDVLLVARYAVKLHKPCMLVPYNMLANLNFGYKLLLVP